ncbi:hypothetical protein PGB90_000606 [Kerria lacca]
MEKEIKEIEKSQVSLKEKQAERLKRLRDIQVKFNEARQINHQAFVEEVKISKLPSNWGAKKRKAEWILNDELRRKEAEEKGGDYERLKLLNMTAIEAENLLNKKKKKNPDQGFADYEQATARQYNRLVRQIKPNREEYERQKQLLGNAFYGDRSAVSQNVYKDSKEGINRMVEDLQKQIAKREKYSRRRAHNDDADIDFINERNMKFNKKLERFYGEYTLEIKQNLERDKQIRTVYEDNVNSYKDKILIASIKIRS